MLKICPKFNRVPIADHLPYVLNPLILLKLIQNMKKDVEINNSNINFKHIFD
jgi:hypothetical protein